jgi:hypothetical protein
MTHRSFHPSYLELDRFALGANQEPSTQDHVRDCETCRQHVERVCRAGVVPEWVADVAIERKRSFRWRLKQRTALTVCAGGLVAAFVALLVAMPLTPETAGIAAKGTPAVGVYVKRNDRVFLWDGRASLEAGDFVRLKVAPSGYEYLTVMAFEARAGSASWTILFETSVEPTGETVLPGAWEIDDSRHREEMLIVFSVAPLAPAITANALLDRNADVSGIWHTRLLLRTLGDNGEKR